MAITLLGLLGWTSAGPVAAAWAVFAGALVANVTASGNDVPPPAFAHQVDHAEGARGSGV